MMSKNGWFGWRQSLMAVVAAAVLGLGSGCGAVSAMANPKVAFALQEPAPMGVVVRRADAAEEAVREVDRLLTQTPVSDEWLTKVALGKEDGQKLLDEASKKGHYLNRPVSVLPVEAWVTHLSSLKAESGDHPNILSSLSPEIASQYQQVAEKNKAFADLKAEIAKEEAALDKAPEAEKAALEAKVEGLEAKADAAEEAFEAAKEAFVDKLKVAAGKVAPETRDKLGPALIALRQALDDAKTANSAALVRYPLALPGISSDVQSQVGVIIADIIEEKTGTRPSMSGVNPEVTLENNKPAIKINGLGPEQLGELSLADVTSEATARTTKWMGKALALAGSVSATQNVISYQADVLDAVLDGFESAGWTRPAAVVLEPKAVTPQAQ